MKTTTLKNEVDSIVIEFASAFTAEELAQSGLYRWRENRLFVALEATPHGSVPVAVSDLEWDYSCLRGLESRAIAAEEGDLLLNGRRVKAEDYLASWERATKTPIALAGAICRGIQPVMHIVRPAAGFGGKRAEAQQTAQLALSSQYATQTGGDRYRWEIPLTEKTSLRDLDAITDVDYDRRAPRETIERRCEARSVPSFKQMLLGAFTGDLFGAEA